MTAQQAIDRSVTRNEIIHIVDPDAATVEALFALCEDHDSDAAVLEFWGALADGSTWRVHVSGSQGRDY